MKEASGLVAGDWAQIASAVLIAITVIVQVVYNRRTIEISRSINFKSQWTEIYDAVRRSPGALEMLGINKSMIGGVVDVDGVIAFWLVHNFFQHWVDATGETMDRENCPTFFDMMESEPGSRYWGLTRHTFTKEWQDIVDAAITP